MRDYFPARVDELTVITPVPVENGVRLCFVVSPRVKLDFRINKDWARGNYGAAIEDIVPQCFLLCDVPLVMELLHRHSGLKQRMIAERFGGLDEGLVSRDRRAIREKIETEPKIRKWFQDLTRLST